MDLTLHTRLLRFDDILIRYGGEGGEFGETRRDRTILLHWGRSVHGADRWFFVSEQMRFEVGFLSMTSFGDLLKSMLYNIYKDMK